MTLSRFSTSFPRRKSEWLLSVVMLGLGVIYTINPQLFGQRPFFHTMAEIMPQPSWAMLCLGAGGARFVALVVNGSVVPLTPAVRVFTGAASFGIWITLTWAAIHSDIAGQTLALWPAFMAFEIFNIQEAATEWAAASPPKSSEVSNAHGTG